ncbi:hypothetical protein ISF_09186 [Cordyceps fumosorosea ARSEF 2679]|uniref:Uncharacterized protein n=1 Tax=Cordyceps fumosorosea (strain ARSEF 2679) TaxID=1081104 RepID=A0A162K3P1_CORFA|nr:hypothetical protein ISF_09186 [Cordyceps fumosorosea ARSEF 2679]OAA52908.1 hypothetical protein ISF_09186 [Cordyceps fumosorosea ARSEF 2679]
MATVLAGASFGAAMIAAGFHNPAVVVSQLRFENWHMVQAFLAATASSIVYYAVADRTGIAKLTPRPSAPIGLLPTPYDGNILGGALLGAGMALSGSCPGTLFAQMAAGARTGFYAFAGALSGGVLWTGLLSKAVARQRAAAAAAAGKPDTTTVNEYLGVSKPAAMLLYVSGFAAVVAATALYTPRFPGAVLPGALGGLLISLSQLLSILTRGSMIGISGSYGELGGLLWATLTGDAAAKPTGYPNVLFAASAGAGALALATLVPGFVAAAPWEVPPPQAVLGGALMVVGARMAGGCTSGHGISGISLLSTSSLITIATTFASGFAVASLVY